MTTKIVVSALAALTVLSTFEGCSTPVDKGDSESHFLVKCDASTTCASGLQCLCGVCTRACTASEECAALSPRAECVAASFGCASFAARTCDVACLSNDACSGLGSGFECTAGRCRTESASSKDAGPDALASDSGGDAAPAGPCGKPGWPARPKPEDVKTPGGDVEITAAVYSVDLGDRANEADRAPTGFNLDGSCGSPQCALPSYAKSVADGADGIDDAFGLVFQNLRNLTGSAFSSESYSNALEKGSSNLLLQVKGWNGEANDDAVVVVLLTAAPSRAAPPSWDGTDVWSVSSDSVLNADIGTPKVVDANAYVSGHRLVAALKDFTVRMHIELSAQEAVSLELPVHGAMLSCGLTASPDGSASYVARECTFGGYLVADDVVHQIGQFPNPISATREPLCAGSNAYKVFRDTMCEQIDSSSPGSGSTGACNALSFGMSCTMLPAHLGGVQVVTPPPNPCPNPAEDPHLDSCANHGKLGPSVADAGAGGTAAGSFDAGRPDASGLPGHVCDRLVTIQCTAEAGCCTAPGRTFYECYQKQLADCQDKAYIDAVSLSPVSGYDTSLATAAFNEFQRRALLCDPSIASWAISTGGLRGIARGMRAPGASCSPSNLLDKSAAAAALASCTNPETTACLPGATDWTCAPRSGQGGTCFTDLNCQDGLYCTNPTLELPGPSTTCEPRKADGQSCTAANECASLLCKSGSCAAATQDNAYCLRALFP